MTPPVFTVIAGANGAGKSTLSGGNLQTFSLAPLLDPDRLTHPFAASAGSRIAAGKEVLRLANKHLAMRESFTIETTLAGRNSLKTMSRARSRGFEVVLVYIGTEDVNINLARIQQRVLDGGHDVPESDVRRRYERSLSHLPIAVQRADHTLLFDNSTESGFQLVGVISPSTVQWFDPFPGWAGALRASVPLR